MDDLQYGNSSAISITSRLVLNLIINGWPSIQFKENRFQYIFKGVLNLIINGWPSIQHRYL